MKAKSPRLARGREPVAADLGLCATYRGVSLSSCCRVGFVGSNVRVDVHGCAGRARALYLFSSSKRYCSSILVCLPVVYYVPMEQSGRCTDAVPLVLTILAVWRVLRGDIVDLFWIRVVPW